MRDIIFHMDTLNKHNKYLKYCGGFIFIFIFIIAGFIFNAKIAPVAHAQSSQTFSGFAWSSTIGWIDFGGSGDKNVSVSLDSDNNIVGYAWSDHIGWIQFGGGLSGFPIISGTTAANASVNPSTGAVTGWARALTLAAYDGDGWISLSGTNYGVTYNPSNGAFSGFAWSSDDIGWMQWNPPTDPVTVNGNNTPPLINITADDKSSTDTISANTRAVLKWGPEAGNPTSCRMTSSPADPLFNGILVAVTNLTGSSTIAISANGTINYSISCTNSAGQMGGNSVAVTTITSPQPIPSGSSGVSMWLDNNASTTSTHIHPADKVILNWDGTAFTGNSAYANDFPSCSGNQISGPSIVTTWKNIPVNAQSASAPITLPGSSLQIGTYSLSLKCSATVDGISVSSSSKPVTITVTNSTIHEQ
jgi:hypothetical protein